jgi:hypothetical protein
MWYKEEVLRMIEGIGDWRFLRMIYSFTKTLYEKKE